MATPLRTVLRPSPSSFAATAPKTPPSSAASARRSLHLTGAHEQPSSYLAFQTRVAELGRKKSEPPTANDPPSRPFNTHRALQSRGDSSPIDMCYFPTREAPATLDAVLPQIPLIPLTPTAPRPARIMDLVHGEAAVEAAMSNARIIATSSGVGIDEGTVQPMSESEGEGTTVLGAKAESELRRVWDGFLDDLLGPRRGGAA